MPYSLKELQNNSYYQSLERADRIEYESKITTQRTMFQNSGSNYYVSQSLRDENGIFLSYEDPDTQLGMQGPWQEVIVKSFSPKLKKGEYFNKILNREFEEL